MINIFIDAFKGNTNRKLISRIYSSFQMEKAEKLKMFYLLGSRGNWNQ